MIQKKLSIAILVLALGLALIPSGDTAQAAPYTKVNSTNDVDDGTCDGSHCSLREAINVANSNSGYDDTISFNIPGCGGVCTIQPLSALPALTDDGTTINGYSQPGTAEAIDGTPAVLLIEIDGSGAGSSANGLTINSAGNVIKGLVINRFSGHGVSISSSGTRGNTVSGNYIGTDSNGTADLGNSQNGVYIVFSAQNNTIGGDTEGERNIISGNNMRGVEIRGSGTTGNIVSGNYIGTDVNGTTDLGNSWDGVAIDGGARNNTVGGDWTAGERNVISGNDLSGVRIAGSYTAGNTVSGNYIGTDESGTVDLGNTWIGVDIFGGAQNNIVGGDTEGERNVISGNDEIGVRIYNSGTTGNIVSGNYIGTDKDGIADLGNTDYGVNISSGAQNNTIGGDAEGERNVISGNDRYGVQIEGSGTMGNTVSGNYIGTDESGTAALGNTWVGVNIADGAQNNTIGGDWTAGERNVISGNDRHGVQINGAGITGNTVSGNYIGTDYTGIADLGNTGEGVFIGFGAQNNTIGGATAGERNVISGNDSDGIWIYGSDTMSNTVSGNYIGTDESGTVVLGNTYYGIYIEFGAQNNTVGPGNIIVHNGSDGVLVHGSTTTGNTITQNSIFSNTMGIDLRFDANGGIAAPVIMTTTPGSINVVGTACAGCFVEVFENSDTDGEGETYVGGIAVTASGAFTLPVSYLTLPYLTATATDAMDGTSEFSEVFTATVPLAPPAGPVYLPIVVKDD
jgi:titin